MTTSDSGAVAAVPVAAAVPVLPPAAPHAAAPDVGAAGSKTPAVPAPPDLFRAGAAGRTAGGAAADSVCLGPDADPVRRTGSTALPAPAWYCVDHDAVHYGECPTVTPSRHRPFLMWLLDKIGRAA